MNGKTEFAKSNNLMELDPATKPKGICLIPGHTNSLLALLGKAKDISNMIAFPPSAVCEQFEVSVRCLNVLIDEDHRKTNGQRISQEDVVTLTNGGNNICAVVTNSEHSPSLRLPDGSIFKGCLEGAGSNKTSLISELTLNEVPELLNSKKVLQGEICTYVLTIKGKCYCPECQDCLMRSIIDVCFIMALMEMTLLFYIMTNLDDNECWIGVQCSSMQLF